MGSICWERSGNAIGHRSTGRRFGPKLLLIGLWILNLVIVAAALPILVFAKGRSLLSERSHES